MKNLKYFPFERNRYFYGKLLTVDDFESEQKYSNDKRRLINRFLHGSGVVCGMNVVRVDDRTISVEMGLALDFSGREIVIDTPVIKKLAMIEGFEAQLEAGSESSYLYLCLEYAETEKDAVHSIASTNVPGTDQVEHNKFAEGYRMFLTSQEPENQGFTIANFYQDTTTIYWGNGLRIKQIMPKYVSSGQDLEIKVVVENMGQQQPIRFEYQMDLTCLQQAGKAQLKVSFDEREFEKAGRYELIYQLKALAVKDTAGTAVVKPETFQLFLGDRQGVVDVKGSSATQIVAHNAKREIMARYYKTAMEEIVKNTYQQSIYLAKLAIIQAGTSYYIENIENMPFKQYVFNNSLAAAINDVTIDEINTLQQQTGEAGDRKEMGSQATGDYGIHTIASGSVILDLGIGGKEGQRFFSQELAHGLGLGAVQISLGGAYTLSDDSEIVYGSPEVFEAPQKTFSGELAAKVNVTKGTFQIGLRLIEASNVRRVRVYWLATKDVKETLHDRETRKLYIKPDVTNIEVRESQYYEAVFVNANDKRVKWRVKEPNGGTINSNGMYTAPNSIGVFEIIAESLAYPELKASTYVVVRDTRTGVEN